MDVYCPKCGEPVDNDELHETATEEGMTYDQVAALFRTAGCRALDMRCNPQTIGSTRASVASALFDMLGDDMDGMASEMQDAEYFGLFS